MSDQHPYAYQAWICGSCDGHLLGEQTETYDLRCETCGHTFASGNGGYADYVPNPDDLVCEDQPEGEST